MNYYPACTSYELPMIDAQWECEDHGPLSMSRLNLVVNDVEALKVAAKHTNALIWQVCRLRIISTTNE